MSPPPEVLFHRYFQQPHWKPLRDREGNPMDVYRGKHSLQQLDPVELGEFLEAIQCAVNEGINEADYGPEHATQPPFHFDYIDCEKNRNALAFCADGVAFIGVTIPLVYRLWDLSHRLSQLGLLPQWSTEGCGPDEWQQRL